MAQVARGFGKEGPMSHSDKKEYVRGVMGPTGNRAKVESKSETEAPGGDVDDETADCAEDCELQGVDITPAQNGYSVTSRHKKPTKGHVGQGEVASAPEPQHESKTHVFGHHSQVASHVQRLLTQHNLGGKTPKVSVAGGSGAIDKG